ncbi:hypothetical protein CQ018_11060 [Arthrobacter sp. MYb227]|uniref:DUF5671 domain-containing protein n=1 Tax=Arthrobacter sp. MYb227 TaxID=1848601 RepID=UPI000CFDC1A2|nr:DUF5671 domain-containing protein [Arthrobacter sp. MYb227]PQZ92988.1 hypothetical protein CQ018_11060 [Arthrobacter sp. MYb227]
MSGYTQTRGALPTVRRLILYILLFALVSIAASGTSQLLGLIITPASGNDSGRTTGLALALAFVLIAGPLTFVLWRSLAKRLLDSEENSAPAWALYMAAMYVTSLIVASTAMFSLLGNLLLDHTDGWQSKLSTALIWAGVWWWQVRIIKDSRRTPRTLPQLSGILSSWYGLVLAAVATVSALTALFSATVGLLIPNAWVGTPWWLEVLSQLPWILGGLLLWWWHWIQQRVAKIHGGFSDVAYILMGILAAGAMMLGGTGYLLYLVIRLLWHQPTAPLLTPIPLALAGALVGSVIFTYSWSALSQRSAETKNAARLVTSGLGLAAGASGLGVCVNALLAALVPPLAGDRGGDLLLAGVVWLLWGAGLWVWAWQPGRKADAHDRRVYLVVVFGLSAVVALVALLIIGFKVFTFLLESNGLFSGLIDAIRAPFGLLVATALVSIYHFVIWRADREVLETTTSPTGKSHTKILLVASGDTSELRTVLAKATGAKVQVIPRSGEEYMATSEGLLAAIGSIPEDSRHIMLLVEGPGSIRVIELAE